MSTLTAVYGNAALKAGTQVPLLPAPGEGYGWYVSGSTCEQVYGGHNAWTNTPSLSLYYNGITEGNNLTASWIGTQNLLTTSSVVLTNIPVVNMNNGALSMGVSTALTGNAAGDNYVVVTIYYRLIALI